MMAQFTAGIADDGLGASAKKKTRTTTPPTFPKPAPIKAKPVPVAPTLPLSDDGGGADDDSEPVPIGSPDLQGEMNQIISSMDSTLKNTLGSRRKAYDAFHKAIGKLRTDAEKEITQAVRRAASALDKAEEERVAKTAEKMDALDALMSAGAQKLAAHVKEMNAVHKDCVGVQEAWGRGSAERDEEVKAELECTVKQALASASAAKKKVYNEPLLQHAASESVRVAGRN